MNHTYAACWYHGCDTRDEAHVRLSKNDAVAIAEGAIEDKSQSFGNTL